VSLPGVFGVKLVEAAVQPPVEQPLFAEKNSRR